MVDGGSGVPALCKARAGQPKRPARRLLEVQGWSFIIEDLTCKLAAEWCMNDLTPTH